MVAVDAPPEALAALLEGGGVVTANLNSPRQTVLSGPREHVEAALEWCRERDIGARMLPVACAFHSPHVAGAQQRFAELLRATQIAAPRVPVYSNTTGKRTPRSRRDRGAAVRASDRPGRVRARDRGDVPATARACSSRSGRARCSPGSSRRSSASASTSPCRWTARAARPALAAALPRRASGRGRAGRHRAAVRGRRVLTRPRRPGSIAAGPGAGWSTAAAPGPPAHARAGRRPFPTPIQHKEQTP